MEARLRIVEDSGLVIVFLCLLIGLSGSTAGAEDVQPYDRASCFVSDAKPTPVEITGNPLDYAGGRIGLDVRGVQLPRGWERDYRFACRFPIIDDVSNRPLFMKTLTDFYGGHLQHRHRDGGLRAVDEAVTILRNDRLHLSLAVGEGLWLDRNRDALSEFEAALARSPFTPKYREHLRSLVTEYSLTVAKARKAVENLTPEDIDFFYSNPGYYIAPDGHTMPSLTGSVDTQFEFIEHARRVRYEYLFNAAEDMAEVVSYYTEQTKAYDIPDFFGDPDAAEQSFIVTTVMGRIVVAGFGSDHHDQDAALLIDLGGNDTYTNNAGGCAGRDAGAALCIDHGGDDHYTAPGRRYVQGFGFLGAGFLVDMAGDDTYEAEHFAQGAGIMGVGAVWDLGGDDIYIANAFCQGAGAFGLGMLLDDSGEDLYDCATLGQGGATTLGMGVLSDLDGDDRYLLAVGSAKDALRQTPGYGQGGAVSFRPYPWRGRLTPYGGVGMLLDSGGNDRYRSEGWCDQGGSYLMSFGALVDSGGSDHYSSNCGQGSGIHLTNAILIDKDGNDIYKGDFRSGGSGGDRSPAFLLDYRGDDTYISKTSSYGTGCKPFSYSLFIDYEGRDTYICPEPRGAITFNNWDSFGGVWPESEPDLWPYAICLDLGGNDDYQVRNRANNTERHSFGHGIHLDLEWDGPDVIGTPGDLVPAYDAYGEFGLPDEVEESPYYGDIRLLQDKNLFVRFQAIGRITGSGPDVIPVLASALRTSSHRQFNRDVMECIHYFLVKAKVTERESPALVGLLDAVDPEVRTIIAADFGIWKIAEAESALIEALRGDEEPSVRRFAVRSLSDLDAVRYAPMIRAFAVNDTSPEVRKACVEFLAAMPDTNGLAVFVSILDGEPEPSLRVAAARAIGEIQRREGAEALLRATDVPDVYLMRAVGKAMAELHEIQGIEMLIESLKFPSIDAFYNYDNNIPNAIAAYAGHDLPEADRYDQQRWREWYQGNKDKIDIKQNVEAYRRFRVLADSVRYAASEEQIMRYEAFLKGYPASISAKRALSSTLNQVAWDMVTAPEGSDAYDPSTGLRYAQRAVELTPDMDYFDTLAEAYFANGRINEAAELCRRMLKQHPGERMFIDRLKRCEQLR